MKPRRYFPRFAWALIFGSTAIGGAGVGDAASVYGLENPPPRTTNQTSLPVMTVRGTATRIIVSVGAAEMRLATSRSSDSYFGGGSRETLQRFLRITLTGFKKPVQDILVHVAYTIREGKESREMNEECEIPGQVGGRQAVIDTEGFQDTAGVEMSSSSLGSATLHTKTKYEKAVYTSVRITVEEKDGDTLYVGEWRK